MMLTNFFLHLHPVSIKKQGIALSYTWCMGGATFFLFLVETDGLAVKDIAEVTVAGTILTQDHKRGRALVPALADIGASRFLANGVQTLPRQNRPDSGIVGPVFDGGFHPRRKFGLRHGRPFALSRRFRTPGVRGMLPRRLCIKDFIHPCNIR